MSKFLLRIVSGFAQLFYVGREPPLNVSTRPAVFTHDGRVSSVTALIGRKKSYSEHSSALAKAPRPAKVTFICSRSHLLM